MIRFVVFLFVCCFFFFNDTATTEIYTLSLHDALPISGTGWYLVEEQTTYYVLSSESKGDDYLVELGEEISPANLSTWFVSQEDVKLSNV